MLKTEELRKQYWNGTFVYFSTDSYVLTIRKNRLFIWIITTWGSVKNQKRYALLSVALLLILRWLMYSSSFFQEWSLQSATTRTIDSMVCSRLQLKSSFTDKTSFLYCRPWVLQTGNCRPCWQIWHRMVSINYYMIHVILAPLQRLWCAELTSGVDPIAVCKSSVCTVVWDNQSLIGTTGISVRTTKILYRIDKGNITSSNILRFIQFQTTHYIFSIIHDRWHEIPETPCFRENPSMTTHVRFYF